MGELESLADRRDRLLVDRRSRAAFRLVARTVANREADASLLDFLVESVDLSVAYRGEFQALAWIREWNSRLHSDQSEFREAGSALRLQVLMRCETANAQIHDLARSIRWECLSEHAWAMNLRLHLCLKNSSLIEASRRTRLLGDSTPFDRARRLTVYATRLAERGDMRQLYRVYRAAASLYRRSDGLRARVFEALLISRFARGCFVDGDWQEALAMYRFLQTQFTDGLGITGLGFHTPEAAFIENELGNPGKAAVAVDKISELKHRPRTPAEKRWRLSWLQTSCEIECQLGNTNSAHRILGAARRLASSISDDATKSFFHAYLSCSEARVRARHGEAQEALALLSACESFFRERGDAGYHGLAKSMITRGEIHLRLGHKAACLDDCRRALTLARDTRFMPVWARAILLKSYLLIDADIPAAESVYEEVLRDLGALRHPVLLFRVVANLYLYTWSLDDADSLELTDLHTSQLDGLKNEIDPDTYRALYDRYITPQVLRRYDRRRDIG